MLLLTKISQEVLIAGKEMPIISLLFFENTIISINFNKTNENKNGIHHGEYLIFKSLPVDFVEKHIQDVTLYVNVEPCIMCESMIQQMGVKKVVFSCENERFGASLLPENAKHTEKLKVIPFIFRKEAVITLRQFYLQENKNAPKTRRKEGRLLDFKTFPKMNWSVYFPSFDLFYSTYFKEGKEYLNKAKTIYNNNLDLEELNMDLITLKVNENSEAIEPILETTQLQAKDFWEEWKEPKKRKEN